ncbi:MAG TPA: ABC transporter ATP-binding protein [Candidatus Saccharimonadales bacterium]|nr:ABC transporter ATP-binding protein [Candidatus Saccharimonadales bacterium]
MADDMAIKVDAVSKDFVLPHERISSVKNAFTSMLRTKHRTKEMQHALHDIHFQIKKGEFFGIVGRNGSGKSTLLKILAGIYQPTRGSVQVSGKLVPFIELGVGFNPELTGRENVYLNGAMLGFSKKEVDAMYDDIVGFAELERFMDQKLKNYSSGMQVRLAFSMATRSEADILLVDEVLAVGDADFQRKCFDYFKELKRNKKTVVFVSHDMEAIREYCDRAVLIEKSEVVYSGSASEVASRYSRLFIADNVRREAGAGVQTNSNRWGDKQLVYTKLHVSATLSSEKTLQITAQATASADIAHPIFGFIIRNAAGQALLGTNSKLLKKPSRNLKKGETVRLEWQIPNIFSDGKYFVDPAIVHEDGLSITDWWEGAASFTSYRENKTSFIVAPEIDVVIEKEA